MQTNSAPPITIDIHPVGTQKVGAGFEVTGEVYFGQGQLLVADDKRAAVMTPVKVQVSSTPFSFWHPGVSTPGTYTVDVNIGGVSARSAPYTVSAPAPALPPVVTPPPPVVITPPAAPLVLTPTSGGSLKDAAGNTWYISLSKSIYENGFAVPGGGNTSKLTIVANVVYAQDAATGDWYVYNPTSKAWTSAAAAPAGV